MDTQQPIRMKYSPTPRCKKKKKGILSFITIDSERDTNVCAKFHGSLSNSCRNMSLNRHIFQHILVWTKVVERPCNPCSSLPTFVIFSHPSSENIIISLTLTAQLVGFISSHWFLTHSVLYIQTDGSSLLPNPPCPTALFPLIWPPLIHQIWPCRLHVD